MNKWISVKDELPEMTEEVTEVDGDREYTLWYESKPVLVFDKTIYDVLWRHGLEARQVLRGLRSFGVPVQRVAG